MPSTKVSTDQIEGFNAAVDARVAVAPPVAGVATDLSNLTGPTNVSESLLPNPDNAKALGSQTKRWTSLSTLLVKFYNAAGTFYTGIKAGAATTNVEFVLPMADGTVGQVLKTDGAGNLAFATVSGGGGSGDFKADGTVPMTGNLNAGTQKITNMADPTNPQDAATRAYVLANAGGGGANTTLSNLTSPVVLNQNIVTQGMVPETTTTYDLGNNSFYYQSGHISNVKGSQHELRFTPGHTAGMNLQAAGNSISGIGLLGGSIQSATQGNSIGVSTISGTFSGSAYLETGNASSSSSGGIVLKTGTASTTRGKITLDAVLNLPVQATPSNIIDGDMWFDGASLKLRVAGVTKTVTLT